MVHRLVADKKALAQIHQAEAVVTAETMTEEFFSLHQLHDLLDGFCEQWEVDRLARFYSTYKNKRYRQGYLTALLDGSAHMEADRFKKEMMIARALSKKEGKTLEQLKPQELGRLAQDHAYSCGRSPCELCFFGCCTSPARTALGAGCPSSKPPTT